MWTQPENDQFTKELFLTGELVRSGMYKQIGIERSIHLDKDDVLPASQDGRIACYMRIENSWSLLDGGWTPAPSTHPTID
jgi:hypothetical protein